MTQCKRRLTDGSRCPNRAKPGLSFCHEHRFQFKSVPDAEKAYLEASKPASKWRLHAGPKGDRPVFPGLRIDPSGVLVADEALVQIAAQETHADASNLFERCVRLLAGLSRQMVFNGRVKLYRSAQAYWVKITPPESQDKVLSRFYDALAAMADTCEAGLYIGQWPLYIRYRDGLAPKGYDADEAGIATNGDLVCADLKGPRGIPQADLADENLDELLLRITPQPARKKTAPARVLVMAATPLYKLMVAFLRDHGLNFMVARVIAPDRHKRLLLEIRTHEDDPGGRIPDFVIQYFQSLPRCEVLTEIRHQNQRRLFVAHGRHLPLDAAAIIELFPEDSLILFTAGVSFTNQLIQPAPSFLDGDDLGAVHSPSLAPKGLKPLHQAGDLPFDIHIRLVPDFGPLPATTALIFNLKEFEWIKRLFERMPASFFSDCLICVGQKAVVLVSQEFGLNDFPFGIPLRRFRGASLFIPLRRRIAPDLPYKRLAKVLKIKEDNFTFLYGSSRINIPKQGFTPLSHAIIFNEDSATAGFEFRPPTIQPQLNRADFFPDADTVAKKDGFLSKAVQRIIPKGRTKALETDEHEKKEVRENIAKTVSPQDDFRQKAQVFESDGDYINAALCFALGGDAVNAAQCYRRAAVQMGGRAD